MSHPQEPDFDFLASLLDEAPNLVATGATAIQAALRSNNPAIWICRLLMWAPKSHQPLIVMVLSLPGTACLV